MAAGSLLLQVGGETGPITVDAIVREPKRVFLYSCSRWHSVGYGFYAMLRCPAS